ncbi:hypothetical protein HY68_36060 [Streptomyces sp. AcH 505]|nr:hypothetical protein HY68_36060 [Streptomyces sp. AcH 505]
MRSTTHLRGQYDKSALSVTAAHDLGPDSVTGERLRQRRTLVGAVDPHQFQQPARLLHERLQQCGGGLGVVHIGRGHGDLQEQAVGVGQDVTLAPVT